MLPKTELTQLNTASPEFVSSWINILGNTAVGYTHIAWIAKLSEEIGTEAWKPTTEHRTTLLAMLVLTAWLHDLGETPVPPRGLTPVGDVPRPLKTPERDNMEEAIAHAIIDENASDPTAADLFKTISTYCVAQSFDPENLPQEMPQELAKILVSAHDIFAAIERFEYVLTGIHVWNRFKKTQEPIPDHFLALCIAASIHSLQKLSLHLPNHPRIGPRILHMNPKLAEIAAVAESMTPEQLKRWKQPMGLDPRKVKASQLLQEFLQKISGSSHIKNESIKVLGVYVVILEFYNEI